MTRGWARRHEARQGLIEHPQNFGFFSLSPTGGHQRGLNRREVCSTLSLRRSVRLPCGRDERDRREAGGQQGGCGKARGKLVASGLQWRERAWSRISKAKGVPGPSEPCLSRKEKGCQTKKTWGASGQILKTSYHGVLSGLQRTWIQLLLPYLPWTPLNSQACHYCLFA